MTAKDEAKQLDSVTDRVTEQESLDASKATAAMASLVTSADGGANATDTKTMASIKVSKEDVKLIVEELEIDDSNAEKAIKEVIMEGIVAEGQSAVGEALRRLVVS